MKNKKLLIIIGIIALLLLVSGVMYSKSKVYKAPESSESTETKGMFTSVKEALSKKMTLACEFSDDKGVVTKSYIKNGAIRVTTGDMADQSSEFIMKDDKMYMWNTKTKEGFVYDTPDANSDITNSQVNQSDAYLNMIDQYKDSCKVTTVSDSYFTLPKDVEFKDMSKMLEDLKKQMPQVPEQ